MNAKRLIVPGLLVVSLGFNLGFLAGAMQSDESAMPTDAGVSRPFPPDGPGPQDDPMAVVQRVARTLELDDDQRAVFANLHEEMRSASAMYSDTANLMRVQVLDELKQPEPDLDRVRTLMAEELEVEQERRENAAALFHEFLERLTAEQRRELAQRLMRGPLGRPEMGRGRGGGGPFGRGSDGGRRGEGSGRDRRGLRAFDEDNDGRLDEAELATAREAVRERWERHRQRRQREILRRFDADGDGELNEAEQAAAQDAEQRRREAIEFRLYEMILERFDADRDGELSDEEMRPIVDWLENPPPPPPPGFEFDPPDDRPGRGLGGGSGRSWDRDRGDWPGGLPERRRGDGAGRGEGPGRGEGHFGGGEAGRGSGTSDLL